MANCPKCHNQLKEDFGIETCSKCGAVVFVDMDDQVSLQEPLESLPDLIGDVAEFSANESSPSESSEDFVELDIIEETSNLDNVEGEDEKLEEESLDLVDPFADQSAEEYELEDSDIDSDFELESSEDFKVLSEENHNKTSADDFLNEMQSFGEIDSERFKEAVYFFDIEISNIDSKETREEIIDVLQDKKLNLRVENINKKIVNGILSLKGIPAVKTHIIVQRISHLPCDISWSLVEVQDLQLNLNSKYEAKSNSLDLEEDQEFT